MGSEYRCGLLSLRRGRKAVTFQDVADRLIAHPVTDLRQRAGDPVIPPGSIVLRETDDQLFNFLIDLGVRPPPRVSSRS